MPVTIFSPPGVPNGNSVPASISLYMGVFLTTTGTYGADVAGPPLPPAAGLGGVKNLAEM